VLLRIVVSDSNIFCTVPASWPTLARRRRITLPRRTGKKLGMTGMDKIVTFDQSQSFDDFLPACEANSTGTPDTNKVVTLRRTFPKKVS
jgi:hypothetical protein